MKRIVLSLLFSLLFVLAGCASSDLMETEIIDCAESGNEVSVMLASAEPMESLGSSSEVELVLGVEVSNNGHDDIEVKSILLRSLDMQGRFRIGAASSKFSEVIPEGKEHVFTLRTTGRYVRTFTADVVVPEPARLEARVALANGQTYRCAFEVPVR